jgi:hypothetical protein
MAEIVDLEKYRKSLKRKGSERLARQPASQHEAGRDSGAQDTPGETRPKPGPDGKRFDPDNKGA